MDHTLITIVNHIQGIASIVSNPDQLSPKLHSAHTQSKMLKNNFAGVEGWTRQPPKFPVQIWCARVVPGDGADLKDRVSRHGYAVPCSGNLKDVNHRCRNKQCPRSKDDKDGKGSK